MTDAERDDALARLKVVAAEVQRYRDAKRYRLIRKFSIEEGASPFGHPVLTDEQFDAEVDALLAELAATEQ